MSSPMFVGVDESSNGLPHVECWDIDNYHIQWYYLKLSSILKALKCENVRGMVCVNFCFANIFLTIFFIFINVMFNSSIFYSL